MNPLVQLTQLGQSPWHDNIRRSQLTSGALARMVQAGDITGLTSNPTIFEQAIAQSDDYTEALAALARAGKTAAHMVDTLMIEDIRAAADVFAPVFERTAGADGYVSIEVSPALARDTASTVAEAKRLWKAVNRPNLMIKIPATAEGIPAIEATLAEGINVNVTLIFSLERYAQVMDAYLRGLERRLAAGKKINTVASVASFFVSRVDTLVDKLLETRVAKQKEKGAALTRALMGRAAIANAQKAYALFMREFTSERYHALAAHGARVQRPLWASTSTKNPAYPDVYYVEALIAPNTVNTMPPATLVAYKNHGEPAVRVPEDDAEANRTLAQLAKAGVDMAAVTAQLEQEGVAAFGKSFDSLLAAVEVRRLAVLHSDGQKLHLGKTRKLAEAALAQLESAQFSRRLWAKDPTLWKPGEKSHQQEIAVRLGWLTSARWVRERTSELTTFAGEIRRAGFTHAVLCGMGGSSLAPEVLRETFGVAKGYLDLVVLDSTDPEAVLAMLARSQPARTLYIIASKSGGTIEPNAMLAFFWHEVCKVKGERRAGENFIAITDPDTAMHALAQERGFRRIFLNPADIGGRFSVLSYFGMVPAALMGIDVEQLLDRAIAMLSACGPAAPAQLNPGLQLGAVLGALGAAGRNKLTLLTSRGVSTLGYWIEQLIAESTGKEGKGILPVEGEPPSEAWLTSKDRLFVHLRLTSQHDKTAAALIQAGQPVVEVRLRDAYDLGAEFARWAVATAAASVVLDVDPFDQPDVQSAKTQAARALQAYADSQHTPVIAEAMPITAPTLAAPLRKLLKAKRGDYVAVLAYVARTPKRDKRLRDLQARLAELTGVPVTVGYGPRFLHSTGQLHKGGPNTGIFVQLVAQDPVDAPVHGQPYTFSVLKAAQAQGDWAVLRERGRRALAIQLGADVDKGLAALARLLAE